MTAQEAHKDLMEELFQFDNNPTYELSAATLEARYGLRTVMDMERAGLIWIAGRNHNGMIIFQVR
jgi:hypothetical protein